jgi:CBS domain-containing protein
MKVSEVMTLEVVTVTPSATLQEAAKLMASMDVGVLPVVANGSLNGIVTDRDIAIRAVAEGKDWVVTRVRDIMSTEVTHAFGHDEVDDVAETMADLQVRRLPVVDPSGCVIGIISLADIAREKRPRKVGEALQGISRPGGQHNA